MKNSTSLRIGFLLLSCSLTALGQPQRVPISALSADALQTWYLVCDQRTTHEVLAFGDAVFCSRVSEELLQKVFGGDFNRMLQWWRVNRFTSPTHSPAEKNAETLIGESTPWR